MRINYRARDFGPGPVKNGHGSIVTTWPELVHAAVTVGRWGWREVLKHGRYSFLEMHYRATMLRANLRQSKGSIAKTGAYRGLDPSEKAAISYYIGLTVASLVARRLFDVRWLIHLDVYQRSLHPHLSRSGRPDLAGEDRQGRWCVIEAKGRSNTKERGLVTRAKDQTLKVHTVCNQKPRFRVASVAFFSREGNLSLSLADPIDHHPDAIDWNFAENQFLHDYYQPFKDLIDRTIGPDAMTVDNLDMTSENVNGMDVLFAPLPDADLQIGLVRSVYDLVRLKNPSRDEVNRALNLGQSTVREDHLRSSGPPEKAPWGHGWTFAGTDGVVVRLGQRWLTGGDNELEASLW